MLANNDSRLVSPQEEDRVGDIDVFIHVLFSCKIEKNVLRLGIENVDSLSFLLGQEGRKGNCGAERPPIFGLAKASHSCIHGLN